MASAKNDRGSAGRRPPGKTPQDREDQLISMAIDLAEKQILKGTASATVMTHFLKLGSEKEKLERERLRRENELLKARVESLQSAKRVEELYSKALEAMRSYAGQEVDYDEDEDYGD